MTVHSIVDRQMDMITAGICDAPVTGELPTEIREYIEWFCKQMEA